jgi:hypothetical protein
MSLSYLLSQNLAAERPLYRRDVEGFRESLLVKPPLTPTLLVRNSRPSLSACRVVANNREVRKSPPRAIKAAAQAEFLQFTPAIRLYLYNSPGLGNIMLGFIGDYHDFPPGHVSFTGRLFASDFSRLTTLRASLSSSYRCPMF